MCKKPKQENQTRRIKNIEDDNQIEKETVKNVENYKTRYKSDYKSSDDNCVAMISDDPSDKIAPQNMEIAMGTNQLTLILDSLSVCSFVTKVLAIINSCTEAK